MGLMTPLLSYAMCCAYISICQITEGSLSPTILHPSKKMKEQKRNLEPFPWFIPSQKERIWKWVKDNIDSPRTRSYLL